MGDLIKIIDTDIDVRIFLDEIEANLEHWDLHTHRQENVDLHTYTKSIFLSTPVTRPHENWETMTIEERQQARDAWNALPLRERQRVQCHSQGVKSTEHSIHYPNTLAWLRNRFPEPDCELCRISFIKLDPHRSVGKHYDFGDYYKYRDRYHLALSGTYEYPVETRDGTKVETITPNPGTLYWFDNKQDHEAHNIGDDYRICMMFDVFHHNNRELYLKELPDNQSMIR